MRTVRAIVTGGAGFIGSHVVDALVARGDQVVVIDSLVHGTKENVHAAAELHVRDIREPHDDLFDSVRPEAVFHLAAQADVRVSVENPVEDADVNVVGTRRIALRYGNVYGPRQDPHGEAGVVAIFLGALSRGEQATIFGDGSQTRDYVYVGDVARATTSTVGQDHGVFNVGTGHETSVVELYELCARVAGSDVVAQEAPARLGELQRSFLDPTRAATELGFTAMVELEDGLRATWEWIQKE